MSKMPQLPEWYRDVINLSNGTLASLTGISNYEQLDRIHDAFVKHSLAIAKECPETFRAWQEAWDSFDAVWPDLYQVNPSEVYYPIWYDLSLYPGGLWFEPLYWQFIEIVDLDSATGEPGVVIWRGKAYVTGNRIRKGASVIGLEDEADAIAATWEKYVDDLHRMDLDEDLTEEEFKHIMQAGEISHAYAGMDGAPDYGVMFLLPEEAEALEEDEIDPEEHGRGWHAWETIVLDEDEDIEDAIRYQLEEMGAEF